MFFKSYHIDVLQLWFLERLTYSLVPNFSSTCFR